MPTPDATQRVSAFATARTIHTREERPLPRVEQRAVLVDLRLGPLQRSDMLRLLPYVGGGHHLLQWLQLRLSCTELLRVRRHLVCSHG